MNVTYFNEPDTSVKSVMVFYGGKYPKKTKPDKDVTLPTRLWPNAKYYIRCNLKGKIGSDNKMYFDKLFRGKEFELVSEAVPADMMFIHHENYNLYGGTVAPEPIRVANAIREWKGPITIFYNDELFSGFDDFHNFLQKRANNPNFLKKNPGVLEKVPPTTDWDKVTVLFNENKITDWAAQHMQNPEIQNVCYLSDIILYDLPKNAQPKNAYNKRGIYIPLFTADRIKVCNRLFNGEVDITFKGSRSNDLKPEIAGDGKYIQNTELAGVLRQYDWTIYIGKGKPSMYLGATFYEPLLNGLPIFMWRDTDRDEKVFPGLNCYFSSGEELRSLVEEWDMRELFDKQVKIIFG
jgi:hypothetical protein